MKEIVIVCFWLSSLSAFGQSPDRPFTFLMGLQTRITPIYLKTVPSHIFSQRVSDQEQPDKHLCGPGLKLTGRYFFLKGFILSYHQVLRYDYLYQSMPLEDPPPPNFNYDVKKRVIFDCYLEVSKIISANKSDLGITGGIALCGLNTGYTQTGVGGTNPVTYYNKKKDFIFPAATLGLNYKRGRIYGDLKMGYCWNDPRLYDTPFLFPEISVQYELFHK